MKYSYRWLIFGKSVIPSKNAIWKTNSVCMIIKYLLMLLLPNIRSWWVRNVDKLLNSSTIGLQCVHKETLQYCNYIAWQQESINYLLVTENPLQWCHNEHDGDSNNQCPDCLLNRLFRRESKKTPKLRVTGLWEGNSPVTGEFPAQRASNAENVSIWWRHHEQNGYHSKDIVCQL